MLYGHSFVNDCDVTCLWKLFSSHKQVLISKILVKVINFQPLMLSIVHENLEKIDKKNFNIVCLLLKQFNWSSYISFQQVKFSIGWENRECHPFFDSRILFMAQAGNHSFNSDKCHCQCQNENEIIDSLNLTQNSALPQQYLAVFKFIKCFKWSSP